MVCEDYVSFETAKLLKEKGFDGCPLFHYDDCGQIWIPGGYNKNKKWHFPAPTLQMAMKWLREVHKIAINAEWKHMWYANIKPMTSESVGDYVSDSYEEACELAIKYCLENLI